jgi:PIN domain nuclease of toxin-antitoxin system
VLSNWDLHAFCEARFTRRLSSARHGSHGEPDLLARKETKGELVFGMALPKWFQLALPTNRVRILEITLEIVIDATRLPRWSHKDPADQIIVATARLHGLKILTSDSKILKYRQVASIASRTA